jgi:hypothetical protein
MRTGNNLFILGQRYMLNDPILNPTSCFNAISTPLSYHISYSTPIINAKSAGVGIVGFESTISIDFSVNITI